MSKLAEVIKSVALQSGVAETEIKELLDNTALSSIELSDEVSTKLTAPRLSLDAAKNNPDLKKHFTALALNGIDAEIERTATEHGLSAEEISEFKKLESTTKRIGAITKKVQALTELKATKPSADTEKLNKQIEELNNQILGVRAEAENTIKQKDLSLENERIDWTLNNILSNFEYATGVDKEINVTVGKTLIGKALQEKGLKITRENNTLVLKTAEGTDYFENNAKVGIQDFTTKTLANAKVLKASSSTPPARPTHTPQGNGTNTIANAETVLSQLQE